MQEAPGQGQEYGLNSHSSSCSVLSVWGSVTSHPDEAYLQGKRTELATFSIARFLMEPRGPRQVGQQVSLGRQLEHTWEGTEENELVGGFKSSPEVFFLRGGESLLKLHQVT